MQASQIGISRDLLGIGETSLDGAPYHIEGFLFHLQVSIRTRRVLKSVRIVRTHRHSFFQVVTRIHKIGR